MIEVDLPYPDKLLWPNGRTRNPRARAALVKKHREWADITTLSVLPVCHPQVFAGEHSLPVRIVVTRKAAGVYPDKDNCVAAAKAYLDGIAGRIGVNDRRFDAPTVEFRPEITGRFVITIGAGVIPISGVDVARSGESQGVNKSGRNTVDAVPGPEHQREVTR